MVKEIIVAAVVYLFGVFTPSFGRAVKTILVKEATTIKADIKAEIAKIEKKL